MSMLARPVQLARLASKSSAMRCISTSSIARKDIIQDLYLSGLKSYSPPPQAKDAHVGSVKVFSAPSTPKAPSSPTDLASELSAYDAAEPALASSAPAKNTGAEDLGTGAEAYLAFLEQDLPKAEHHH